MSVSVSALISGVDLFILDNHVSRRANSRKKQREQIFIEYIFSKKALSIAEESKKLG